MKNGLMSLMANQQKKNEAFYGERADKMKVSIISEPNGSYTIYGDNGFICGPCVIGRDDELLVKYGGRNWKNKISKPAARL